MPYSLHARSAPDRSALLTTSHRLRDPSEPERGARLFGAAEVLRETIGAHIQAGDRPDYEKSLALTRDQLDAEMFDAAWAEGRALSLEQMVDAAVEPIRA